MRLGNYKPIGDINIGNEPIGQQAYNGFQVIIETTVGVTYDVSNYINYIDTNGIISDAGGYARISILNKEVDGVGIFNDIFNNGDILKIYLDKNNTQKFEGYISNIGLNPTNENIIEIKAEPYIKILELETIDDEETFENYDPGQILIYLVNKYCSVLSTDNIEIVGATLDEYKVQNKTVLQAAIELGSLASTITDTEEEYDVEVDFDKKVKFFKKNTRRNTTFKVEEGVNIYDISLERAADKIINKVIVKGSDLTNNDKLIDADPEIFQVSDLLQDAEGFWYLTLQHKPRNTVIKFNDEQIYGGGIDGISNLNDIGTNWVLAYSNKRITFASKPPTGTLIKIGYSYSDQIISTKTDEDSKTLYGGFYRKKTFTDPNLDSQYLVDKKAQAYLNRYSSDYLKGNVELPYIEDVNAGDSIYINTPSINTKGWYRIHSVKYNYNTNDTTTIINMSEEDPSIINTLVKMMNKLNALKEDATNNLLSSNDVSYYALQNSANVLSQSRGANYNVSIASGRAIISTVLNNAEVNYNLGLEQRDYQQVGYKLFKSTDDDINQIESKSNIVYDSGDEQYELDSGQLSGELVTKTLFSGDQIINAITVGGIISTPAGADKSEDYSDSFNSGDNVITTSGTVVNGGSIKMLYADTTQSVEMNGSWNPDNVTNVLHGVISADDTNSDNITSTTILYDTFDSGDNIQTLSNTIRSGGDITLDTDIKSGDVISTIQTISPNDISNATLTVNDTQLTDTFEVVHDYFDTSDNIDTDKSTASVITIYDNFNNGEVVNRWSISNNGFNNPSFVTGPVPTGGDEDVNKGSYLNLTSTNTSGGNDNINVVTSDIDIKDYSGFDIYWKSIVTFFDTYGSVFASSNYSINLVDQSGNSANIYTRNRDASEGNITKDLSISVLNTSGTLYDVTVSDGVGDKTVNAFNLESGDSWKLQIVCETSSYNSDPDKSYCTMDFRIYAIFLNGPALNKNGLLYNTNNFIQSTALLESNSNIATATLTVEDDTDSISFKALNEKFENTSNINTSSSDTRQIINPTNIPINENFELRVNAPSPNDEQTGYTPTGNWYYYGNGRENSSSDEGTMIFSYTGTYVQVYAASEDQVGYGYTYNTNKFFNLRNEYIINFSIAIVTNARYSGGGSFSELKIRDNDSGSVLSVLKFSSYSGESNYLNVDFSFKIIGDNLYIYASNIDHDSDVDLGEIPTEGLWKTIDISSFGDNIGLYLYGYANGTVEGQSTYSRITLSNITRTNCILLPTSVLFYDSETTYILKPDFIFSSFYGIWFYPKYSSYPTGTSVQYLVSLNNGSTWSSYTPSDAFSVPYGTSTDNILLKIIMSTTDNTKTPVISNGISVRLYTTPELVGYRGTYAYDVDSGETNTWKLNVDTSIYETDKSVISVPIFEPNKNILKATLTASDLIPSDTQITYYMSNDNGTTWESVSSGVEHTFTSIGAKLKWKATLETNDITKTPEIYSVTVNSYHRVFTYYYLSNDGGSSWETATSGDEHTFTSTGQDLRYRIVMESADGYHTPRIRNVKLEAPANAVITYYMSADGGTNWEQVASGNEHAFENTGTSLMWKATLTSNTTAVIPSIQDVSLATPANSTIQYYLSNNGGTNWFKVEKDVAHTFETAGTTLMWKAEMSTNIYNLNSVRPKINEITLHWAKKSRSYLYFSTDDGSTWASINNYDKAKSTYLSKIVKMKFICERDETTNPSPSIKGVGVIVDYD